MKSRLKYIDANETDGNDLKKVDFVYDVVRGGVHIEHRITGRIELEHHVAHMKSFAKVDYTPHSTLEKIKHFFS